MGKIYKGIESAQQFEDDIVESGKMITILSDDEYGVVIGIGGNEE